MLISPTEQQWTFYLYLGCIMYVTRGIHPVRRWQRNLAVYCPQMKVNRLSMQRDLACMRAKASSICWQYQLLCLWAAQQNISSEQVAQLIPTSITESLFDIAQARRATYQIKQDNKLSSQLVLIDVDQAIAEIEELWDIWHHDLVANYSPNQAPVIKEPKLLQQRVSPQVYQSLSKLLDGQHTLRDLSVRLKRDVRQLTHSFLPYMQWGLVELVNIPDLPAPVFPKVES